MPVREPARDAGWPMGRGAHSGEDETLPVAKAVLIGEFEFVERTPDKHLRHSRFTERLLVELAS